MPTSRNHLWIADKGIATIEGKPAWPSFLTLSLTDRDAWNLHYSLSHQLRERAMNPDTKGEPIVVLVGGGELKSS